MYSIEKFTKALLLFSLSMNIALGMMLFWEGTSGRTASSSLSSGKKKLDVLEQPSKHSAQSSYLALAQAIAEGSKVKNWMPCDAETMLAAGAHGLTRKIEGRLYLDPVALQRLPISTAQALRVDELVNTLYAKQRAAEQLAVNYALHSTDSMIFEISLPSRRFDQDNELKNGIEEIVKIPDVREVIMALLSSDIHFSKSDESRLTLSRGKDDSFEIEEWRGGIFKSRRNFSRAQLNESSLTQLIGNRYSHILPSTLSL